MNRVARMSMKTVTGVVALFTALAGVSVAMGAPNPEQLTRSPALRDSIQASSKKFAAQDKSFMKMKRKRSPASVTETRAGPMTLRANTGPRMGEEIISPSKTVYQTAQ